MCCLLPQDPRTFLKTPQKITIWKVGMGGYWHHGLENSIVKYIPKNVLSTVKNISININIDGLPIYKCAKDELWPILFNI